MKDYEHWQRWGREGMQKASVHIGQRNTKHERVPMITNDYNLLCRTALSFTRQGVQGGDWTNIPYGAIVSRGGNRIY